jgi:DNA-binding LytR/AlgR family response regulator
MTKVVIIEDEPHARQELKRQLKTAGREVTVVAELESVEEAVLWLAQHSDYDVLLVDIQLSDGLSFDIFNQEKVNKPVIFTTAFNEYAIRAFELNSIDYLLKPVEPAALNKALAKLENLKQVFAPVNINGDQLREMLGLSKKETKTRFLTKVGDQFKHIPVEAIAYFVAERNTVWLVTHQNQRFVVDYNLEQLEQQLDRSKFFRANRSYILSITCIKKVHKYFNSRLLIETEPKAEEQLTISRLKVEEFLLWMDQ